MARIVQRPMSCENAAIKPSMTATHRAIRTRRCRSQRPPRVVPASIIGWLYATFSTVPRWCGEPRAPFGRNLFSRGARLVAVQEEAVHRGTGARRVRTKGTEREEFVGQ